MLTKNMSASDVRVRTALCAIIGAFFLLGTIQNECRKLFSWFYPKVPFCEPPCTVEATTLGRYYIERPNQGTFEHIYSKGLWNGDGSDEFTGGGGSGPGSNPDLLTYLPSIIEDVISTYKVSKFLDAPCGRVRWTSKLLRELAPKRKKQGLPELEYMGLDVVSSVIKRNKQEFKHEKMWTFKQMDLETEAIPQGYDIILCRDALQHLPLKSVLRVLKNFSQSDSKYLLVTSYPTENVNNNDIVLGGYNPYELKKPPFSLTEVVHEYDEGKWRKFLYLYDINYLKTIDFDAMIDEVDNKSYDEIQ
eukprot:CFRG2032T1